MNILSTKKLLITALTIWGVLLNTSSVRAQTAVTLGDLPIGSVIQIMGTDTGMCDTSAGNAGNCATQNAPVLPYKLVKMLARNSDGTAKVGNSGFGAAGNYTYWMLMDNYCWWGSANCYYLGNRSGAYQSFNHDNSGSAGTSPTNYHNNLSIHLANNILIRLDNFYNSLPAQIGGFTKAAAIPTYDWDMMPMSNGNPSVAGWGSTHGTWTAGTYNPSGDTTNQFVFSGGNGAPVMNSRIGLLSYTEWQGGTFAYGQYPGRSGGISLAAVAANTVGNGTFQNQVFSTHQAGSGASFCLARWGTSNCAVSDENTPYSNTDVGYYINVFNPDPSYSGIANLQYMRDNGTLGYLQLQGPANPRVRHPWFRNAYSTSGSYAWRVYAYRATYSVYAGNAVTVLGLSRLCG